MTGETLTGATNAGFSGCGGSTVSFPARPG